MLAPQSGTYQHDTIDHHDKDWEPRDERECSDPASADDHPHQSRLAGAEPSITMLLRSGDQLRGEVGKAGQQVDALGGDELDADVVGAGIEVLGDPRSDLFCVT